MCLFVLLSRHESKVLPGVTPTPPPPGVGRARCVTITPPDLPCSSQRLVGRNDGVSAPRPPVVTPTNDRGMANHLCIKALLHVRRHASLYYRPSAAARSPPPPIDRARPRTPRRPTCTRVQHFHLYFYLTKCFSRWGLEGEAWRARCEECECVQRVWERAKRCGTAAVIWPGSHQHHHHAPPHVARTLPLHARSHTHGVTLSHAGPSPPTLAAGTMLAPHALTRPR